jgi:hypothetical protein
MRAFLAGAREEREGRSCGSGVQELQKVDGEGRRLKNEERKDRIQKSGDGILWLERTISAESILQLLNSCNS